MRGAFYAATEIVVFLAIATIIGILIGRLWAAATAPKPDATPSADKAARPAASGDEDLAKAKERLAAMEAEQDELRKQLSVTEWQVSTLEEELAKHAGSDAD